MPSVTDEKRLHKIGEVCRIADVQPYVLRYWETEFAALAPNKSGGGQRLYTQREIDVILRIKQLLYSDGFTIAGAKKKLDAELADPAAAVPADQPAQVQSAAPADPRAGKTSTATRALLDVRKELSAILAILDD